MGIAKMTGGAFFRLDHPGVIIPRINCQDFGWTEFHADMASFAPGGVKDYFTARTSFGGSRRAQRRLGLQRNTWHKVPYGQTALPIWMIFYYKKFLYRR
jgi:hypothetical protein